MKEDPQINNFRWTITLLLGLAICANHYTRDSIGALEIQFEEDLYSVSPSRYSELNSLYFTPNILTPLIGGYLAQRYGNGKCLIFSQILSSLGNVIFCVGVYTDNFQYMLAGRVAQGSTYAVSIIFFITITNSHNTISECIKFLGE